jgi:outer membrane protein OmpA-like peptidoglycan-associated protein
VISKKQNVSDETQFYRANVYFENNSSFISQKASQTIKNILAHSGNIQLEGFTSRLGTESRNQTLRLERAMAVRQLIKLMEPTRTVQIIKTKNPAWAFDTPSLNRRVQIIIQGDKK